MSEGPIRKWRDGFKVPPTSTNPKTATHMQGTDGRAYCGRRTINTTLILGDVTCADCRAAITADEQRRQ